MTTETAPHVGEHEVITRRSLVASRSGCIVAVHDQQLRRGRLASRGPPRAELRHPPPGFLCDEQWDLGWLSSQARMMKKLWRGVPSLRAPFPPSAPPQHHDRVSGGRISAELRAYKPSMASSISLHAPTTEAPPKKAYIVNVSPAPMRAHAA